MNLKENIIEKLSDIEQWESNSWKKKAYKTAINVLSGYDKITKDNLSDFDPGKISGIGTGISSKINEIAKTGTCKKWDELSKTNKKIDKNIKVKKSGNIKKITWKKALKNVEPVIEKLKPYCKKISVAGSLRRKKPMIADADILLWPKSKRSWNEIKILFSSITKRIDAEGDIKMSGILKNGFQIDLNRCEGSWGSQLLHFTGSLEHNIMLRKIANKKGWSLSQYGIKKNGKTEKFSNEKQVFKILNVPFVSPEKR